MSDQYIGEIRLFGFPRIPDGWLACDGSLQSIAVYTTLFTLIGTTYGGDGSNTFGLPDLRGRVPLSQGTGQGLTPRSLGQLIGEAQHTLVSNEMPLHSHGLVSTTNPGTTATPATNVHLAASNTSGTLYAPQGNISGYTGMAPAITQAGNTMPHDNMMPTLTCNFCIAYEGIYPSAN